MARPAPARWSGAVEIDGAPAHLSSIRGARGEGLGLVTDDRRGSGLMLRDSVGRNLVLTVLRRVSPFFLMSRRARGGLAREAIQRLRRAPAAAEVPVGALSGGNQQKVVLAKEVLGGPRLLLLDEPTRGVDVGAKGEIYARIRELAGKGLGVLIASSEMPELLGLCDRVIVLQARPHGRGIPGRRGRARGAGGGGDQRGANAWMTPRPSATSRPRRPPPGGASTSSPSPFAFRA